jgi:hypothetical protein
MPTVVPEGCTKNLRIPQAKLAKQPSNRIAVSPCQQNIGIFLKFLFLLAAIVTAGHQAMPVDC